MCIRVAAVPRAQLEEPWDRDQRLISIPSELRDDFALRAVRAVLTELDIPQPESGALCWCGEQIQLLAHIPQQRSKQVSNGA
ncbi:hypothetical protein F3K39_28445 [Streptomyces sp. LBUM 1479]|uniref:hypothetical protein n=1 Tax=Streptomyces scabiei TaxID=1930 RepID=UPI001B33C225|nr:hypothetical protein [Streptomyces scabiei]MBP5931866.1 hypothetical protein [Streptomyces sp. LBUM 1479]MDX3033740.1 hypothetical protein [Streptomyces scabiei]